MNLNVVVLAAGLGKRMRSRTPKILHEALGVPMLQHVINAVKPLRPAKTVVVIGNGAEAVKKRMAGESHLSFVVQKQLLGTGDALSVARKDLRKGPILVLNGDCPLITTKTLMTLIRKHKQGRNALSFLVFKDNAQTGYGRIIRDGKGMVTGIVEDKHATPEQKAQFPELNGGVYLLEAGVLKYLDRIRRNRTSGEYYLTDIIGIASRNRKKVEAYLCSPEEIRGVNNREELFEVADILRRRILKKWMTRGVTFVNPDASFVSPAAHIGQDSVIYPNTYLEGATRIGDGCIIYPGVRIIDSIIGNNVTVKDNTLIEQSRIGSGSSVGPFAHLRPHTVTGRDVKIGNFVEIKKSTLGDGTKASHLSYLGDAVIKKDVNIGAGTITCNYDGRDKFRTVIEAGVFIGSDSQLVAPVKIGKGAYVAAGSTVTKDVPAGSLAITRVKQQNLLGWIKKKKARVKS